MIKYRRDYDTIIAGSIVIDLYFNDQKIIFFSFTDIYNFVREIYPTVGKDTIQRHLNRMVKEHFLVRLPKEYSKSYKNRTVYLITPEGHKLWDQTLSPEDRKLIEERKRRYQLQEQQRRQQQQQQND